MLPMSHRLCEKAVLQLIQFLPWKWKQTAPVFLCLQSHNQVRPVCSGKERQNLKLLFLQGEARRNIANSKYRLRFWEMLL